MALVLAALVLAATGCTSWPQPAPSPGETPSSVPAGPRDVTPVVGEAPTDVREGIARAIERDRCAVHVSASDVTRDYQLLFTTSELPDLTLEEIDLRLAQVEASLADARSRLRLPEPPARLAELQEDADGRQRLPLSAYKEMATTFFSENYRTKPLFEWTPSSTKTAPELWAGLWPSLRPVYEDHPYTRATIVNTVRQYMGVDKDLVRHDGVALVNLQHDVPGLDSTTAAMVLDSVVGGRLKHPVAYDIAPLQTPGQTVVHELYHALTRTCRDARVPAWEPWVEDPAYTSFNPPGFAYGADASRAAAAGDANGVTTADDGWGVPGVAITARSYGLLNEREDAAVVFEALHGVPTSLLSWSGAADVTVVRQKAALLLARLATTSPATRDHILAQVDAARLSDHLVRAAEAVGPPMAESEQEAEPPADPVLVALRERMDRLDAARAMPGR